MRSWTPWHVLACLCKEPSQQFACPAASGSSGPRRPRSERASQSITAWSLLAAACPLIRKTPAAPSWAWAWWRTCPPARACGCVCACLSAQRGPHAQRAAGRPRALVHGGAWRRTTGAACAARSRLAARIRAWRRMTGAARALPSTLRAPTHQDHRWNEAHVQNGLRGGGRAAGAWVVGGGAGSVRAGARPLMRCTPHQPCRTSRPAQWPAPRTGRAWWCGDACAGTRTRACGPWQITCFVLSTAIAPPRHAPRTAATALRA